MMVHIITLGMDPVGITGTTITTIQPTTLGDDGITRAPLITGATGTMMADTTTVITMAGTATTN